MSGFMGYVYRNRAGLLTGLSVFAVGYGGVVLWKDNLIQGKRFELPEDPEESSRQKVFLVTGANSGKLSKFLTSLKDDNLSKCVNSRNW